MSTVNGHELDSVWFDEFTDTCDDDMVMLFNGTAPPIKIHVSNAYGESDKLVTILKPLPCGPIKNRGKGKPQHNEGFSRR